MGARQVALEHYRRRARLVRDVELLSARLWRRVDRSFVADSWAVLVPQLLAVLAGAQRQAAGKADAYLSAVLAEQDLDTATVGRVNLDGLTRVASDGRDLEVLLNQPALTTLAGIGRGVSVDRSLAAGEAALRMITATQVADAGRAADQVAMTARRAATGYRRMLVGASCSRCVILAGKWFRYNTGFDRHPKCDCVHVPGREDTADDVRTDPGRYFNSLSRDEQDRVFTKAGAEAVRLGANIGQVVNARRGAHGLTPAGARLTGQEAQALRGSRKVGRLEAVDVYGRPLFVTTEGVTTRGVAGASLGAKDTGAKKTGGRYRSAKPPRLMPESILRIAGDDRDEAIRLLKRFGYLL